MNEESLAATEPLVFEGAIICVTLADGLRLYKPQTLPERYYTRMYDQLTLCGSHERKTEEIITVESFAKGVLSTEDRFRAPSMRRWVLVDLLQEDS